MRASDIFRLVLLAAIWGGSFVFLRVVAPALGPIVTADLRVLIASGARLRFIAVPSVSMWVGGSSGASISLSARSMRRCRFFFFAFAALHIPASYSAILNATSPFFGALFAWLWLGEKITLSKSVGFVFGIAGVGLVTGVAPAAAGRSTTWAMGACLLAAASYGFVSVYTKKFATDGESASDRRWQPIDGRPVPVPLTPLAPPPGPVTAFIAVNMIFFALLSSGVAFLLYFRLIADIGPTKSLTVTFLMPAFTMIWAGLFLGEMVTILMIMGCGLILAGTALVVMRR